MILLIYGTYRKGTNELTYKTEIELQMQKTNMIIGQGVGGVWKDWEIGIDIYTLRKKTTKKNLLQRTENSTQCSVMAYMGKESKKEWIYKYV